MMTLYKEIGNKITDMDIPLCDVAYFIESTKQELSDYLNGKKGIGFRKLLRISYLLYPETQKIVMREWCLRLGTTESIKQAFEYASITRDKDLLKKLIDKHSDEGGTLSKWVAIYTILYKFYTNSISALDIPKELKKAGSMKDELHILGLILTCYYKYYKEKYGSMLETAHEVEELINELSDRHLFIKECFLHRIAEILGNVGVFMNDKEATRYYANVLISANMCAKTVSDAYYLIGMTYLTEDSQKCIESLQLRYEISKKVGEVDIEENARRDLDFAKLYLGIKLDNDADNILIRLQENKGSEFELKLIKEAFYQQGDDDFLVLIEAMAHGTVPKLNECRKQFVKKMNYLFGSLAALEMKKLGENHFLLDEQIEQKHEIKGDVEFEENYIKCFTDYRSYRRSSVA